MNVKQFWFWSTFGLGLGLLQTRLLEIFLHKSFYGLFFSPFFWVYSEEWLWLYKKLLSCFPKSLCNFILLPAAYESFSCCITSPIFGSVHCDFSLCFSKDWWCWAHFHVFISHSCIFSCSIGRVFWSFLCGCCFVTDVYSSLYF